MNVNETTTWDEKFVTRKFTTKVAWAPTRSTNKATIVEELVPPTNVVNLEEYQQTSFLWFSCRHKPSRIFLKDFVFFIEMQEPSYVEVMSHAHWK